MIKLIEDTIDKIDINALCDWLQQNHTPQLTQGSLVKQFEEEWSKWLGIKYSTHVNSGSSAIILALSALKEAHYIKENDTIVVPDICWATDLSSVMNLGFNPVLCDCNLQDLSVDLNHLEKIFKTEEPRALLLVSVLGLVPMMDEIIRLCKKYNVLLIEDVCESQGSLFEKQKLGTFGIISLFSMFYGHTMSCIESGMICTNNKELNNIIISLRAHGWDRNLDTEEQQTLRKLYKIDDFNAFYTFYYPGYNFRATEIQAFLGLRQLDKVDEFIKRRRENYLEYISLLDGKQWTPFSNGYTSNFAFPVIKQNRNKVVKKLQEVGVEVRPLISGAMSRQPMWTNKYGHSVYNYNATIVSEQGFYVPNHPKLTKEDIKLICKILLLEK